MEQPRSGKPHIARGQSEARAPLQWRKQEHGDKACQENEQEKGAEPGRPQERAWLSSHGNVRRDLACPCRYSDRKGNVQGAQQYPAEKVGDQAHPGESRGGAQYRQLLKGR